MTGRPDAELAEAADRLVAAEVLAGRPLYIDGGDLKSMDGGKLRLISADLLDQLIIDARNLFAGTWPVPADYRHTEYPGMAQLLALAELTTHDRPRRINPTTPKD